MELKCVKIQEILVDIQYGEANLEADIKEHITNCEECKSYYDSLVKLKSSMDFLDFDIEIDKALVEDAFNVYNKKVKLKKLAIDYMIYVLFTSIFFAGVMFLIKNGYISYILFMQIIVFAISPFIIPFVIKKRFLEVLK